LVDLRLGAEGLVRAEREHRALSLRVRELVALPIALLVEDRAVVDEAGEVAQGDPLVGRNAATSAEIVVF
jgi:hypothetical protein